MICDSASAVPLDETGLESGTAFMVRPEKVARAVVRAIEKDKAELVVMPGPGRLLKALMDFFPGLGPDSYCKDYGDAPALALEVVFNKPLEELEQLLVRSRSLIVIDWRANREVHSAIRDVLEVLPRAVAVRRAGAVHQVGADELAIGEAVLVNPGGHIPVDGTVIAGHSFVDQARITGESMPVEKTAGAAVFAGSINQSGALDIRAERLGRATKRAGRRSAT